MQMLSQKNSKNSNKQSLANYQGAMVETNNKEIMNFFALLRDTMHI